MIALAALAAALVSSAEPAAAAEPPPAQPPASARPDARESPFAAEPPLRPAAAVPAAPSPPPDIAPAPGTAALPPSAPPTASIAHPEWSLFAGWLGTRLLGVGVQSVQLRAAAGLAVHDRVLLQSAIDAFAGQTRPGLAVRGGSLGVEAWLDPAGRVRAGIGPAVSAVAYRRFTSPGEWPFFIAPGVRGGIEIDVLRLPAGTIVLGGHASAYLGTSLSGSVSAGFRGGGARHTAR